MSFRSRYSERPEKELTDEQKTLEQKTLEELNRQLRLIGIIEKSDRPDARRQVFLLTSTNGDYDSKFSWEKIKKLCNEIYEYLKNGEYGKYDCHLFNDVACIFKRVDRGDTRRYQKILDFLLENNCPDELLYHASSLINEDEKLALEYFDKAL